MVITGARQPRQGSSAVDCCGVIKACSFRTLPPRGPTHVDPLLSHWPNRKHSRSRYRLHDSTHACRFGSLFYRCEICCAYANTSTCLRAQYWGVCQCMRTRGTTVNRSQHNTLLAFKRTLHFAQTGRTSTCKRSDFHSVVTYTSPLRLPHSGSSIRENPLCSVNKRRTIQISWLTGAQSEATSVRSKHGSRLTWHSIFIFIP